MDNVRRDFNLLSVSERNVSAVNTHIVLVGLVAVLYIVTGPAGILKYATFWVLLVLQQIVAVRAEPDPHRHDISCKLPTSNSKRDI